MLYVKCLCLFGYRGGEGRGGEGRGCQGRKMFFFALSETRQLSAPFYRIEKSFFVVKLEKVNVEELLQIWGFLIYIKKQIFKLKFV